MFTLGERIFEIRKKMLGLTLDEFGKRIGISKGYASQIELNVRIPDDRILMLIEKEFDISVQWLKTGNGPIRVEKNDDILFAQLTPDDQILFDGLKKYVILKEDEREYIREILALAVNMIEKRLKDKKELNQAQNAKVTVPLEKRG